MGSPQVLHNHINQLFSLGKASSETVHSLKAKEICSFKTLSWGNSSSLTFHFSCWNITCSISNAWRLWSSQPMCDKSSRSSPTWCSVNLLIDAEMHTGIWISCLQEMYSVSSCSGNTNCWRLQIVKWHFSSKRLGVFVNINSTSSIQEKHGVEKVLNYEVLRSPHVIPLHFL